MASEDYKGLFSIVGDPLGKMLAYNPVGVVARKIGDPNGQALLDVERQAKQDYAYIDRDNSKPDEEFPGGERLGVEVQTAKNPLGLQKSK